MRRLILAITVSSLLLGVAHANPEAIGKVLALSGDLVGIDLEENVVNLEVNSLVFKDQILGVGENSKAQFLLNDGTLVSASASAIFSVNEFRYNKDADDAMLLRIEDGTLRILSGEIDRDETPGIRVMTSEGLIEVLGTLLVVTVADDGTIVGCFDGSCRAITPDSVRALGIGADFNFAKFLKDPGNEILPLLSAPEALAAIEAVRVQALTGTASQSTYLQGTWPVKLFSLADLSRLKFKLKIDDLSLRRLMLKLRDRQVDLHLDGLNKVKCSSKTKAICN